MWSVPTPASRAWLLMSRPSGFWVNRETQATDRPSHASPTAVLSSAPPTKTSRLRACSRRRKLAGLRRSIASPNVITSNGMAWSHGYPKRGRESFPIPVLSVAAEIGNDSRPLFGACLFDKRDILAGEVANALEIALGDSLRLNELSAHAKGAGPGLEEGRSRV